MRRQRNWLLPLGFLVCFFALLSYELLIPFPIFRDFPWANLLLFAAGAVMLGVGIRRAFRQRDVYRGRVLGPILGIFSALLLGLFCYGAIYMVRQIPASKGAPQVGQAAPEFSLPDQDAKLTTLSEMLRDSRAVLLTFYRGHW